MLEFLGLALGLLYLYWEFRAHPRMWIASLAMTCISLHVYWSKGLYADFGINIYYLLAAIYGLTQWSKPRAELPITHTPRLAWPCLALAFAAVYGAIAGILVHWTDSNVPYWDALNTSLSIIAMAMMARKWVEQWLVWLVVDAVSVGLYIKKGIEPYAVLYAVYTVLAWVGYRHWRRLMNNG